MAFELSDYEPVISRVQKFYERYPDGAIHTEIVFDDGIRVVIKASVYRNIADPMPAGVDYAEELLADRGVNASSRVENAATSAVGRAVSIAAGNLAPSDWTKKATREEMAKVQRRERVAAAPAGDVAAVQIKGKAHGPIPPWLIKAAADARVEWVWDNRDQLGANPKRPHFKNVNGDEAFWPPKDAPPDEEPF